MSHIETILMRAYSYKDGYLWNTRDIEKLDIPLSQDPKYASWLKDCYQYSKKSNHPSTHNAALLFADDKMVLEGVNIFPPGVKEVKERFE